MKISSILILTFFSLNGFCQTNSDKNDIFNAILNNFNKTYKEQKFLLIDSTYETNSFNNIKGQVLENYFGIKSIDSLELLRKNYFINSNNKSKLEINGLSKSTFTYIDNHSLKKIFEPCTDTIDISNGKVCWSVINDSLKFDGYCGLSNIYFFDNKTALVYFFHVLGPFSGGGYIYILKKTNDHWQIVEELWQWIS